MLGKLLFSTSALTTLAIVACSSPAFTSEPTPTAAGLDVSGASNTPCTVTVARGGTAITWDVSAPEPPVAQASSGTRPPIAACHMDDAGSVSVTSSSTSSAGVQATRSSTQLCFAQDGSLMGAFDFDRFSGDCPVTLTLVCGGVTLYDNAPWNVCVSLG